MSTTVWINTGWRDVKTKEPPSCLCGCKTPCRGDFAPGHDARYKSYLRKKGVEIAGKTADLARKHGPMT